MYLTTTFFASLIVSASALVTPHHQGLHRRSQHSIIASKARLHDAAVADPITPVIASEPIQRRQVKKRCKARPSSSILPASSVPSSSHAPSSPSSSAIPVPPPPANVGGDPNSSTAKSKPTSQPAPPPPPPPQPTTTKAKPTPTQAPPPPPPAPTTQAPPPPSSGGNSGDPYSGSHSGDGTFYGTGLGACGITNNDSQFIVAVSHILFDNAPGYNGVNPNSNPLCGKKLNVNFQGKQTTVTITDRCVGCAQFDLDFSPSAFDVLADPSIGRLHNVDWSWA